MAKTIPKHRPNQTSMNLRCVSVKKTHLFINGKTQFQKTNIIEDTYVYCNIPSTTFMLVPRWCSRQLVTRFVRNACLNSSAKTGYKRTSTELWPHLCGQRVSNSYNAYCRANKVIGYAAEREWEKSVINSYKWKNAISKDERTSSEELNEKKKIEKQQDVTKIAKQELSKAASESDIHESQLDLLLAQSRSPHMCVQRPWNRRHRNCEKD